MSHVFVVDAARRPLAPVHPGRARLLLKAGKAAVFKHYPFTLILKRCIEHPEPSPLRLKIDPGSQTTGLALVDEARGEVVWAAELTHQGQEIVARLRKRRAARRSRRQRHTRYRPARYDNRRRKDGWLPPSLRSRVRNVLTWVQRLRRLCPLTALSLELVRFDTQALQDPDMAGVMYQQGTLAGWLGGQGVSVGKVGQALRVLRCDRCPAGDRAHRAAKPWGQQPREQSDARVCAV